MLYCQHPRCGSGNAEEWHFSAGLCNQEPESREPGLRDAWLRP